MEGVEFAVNYAPTASWFTFFNSAWIDAELDSGDVEDPVVDFDGNRFRLQPETSISAGVRYTFSALAGSIDVGAYWDYRSNVFFEEDNAPKSGVEIKQGAYDTWSLRGGYLSDGGRYEVELYVNNLLDEEFAIDGGNTGGDLGSPTFIAGPQPDAPWIPRVERGEHARLDADGTHQFRTTLDTAESSGPGSSLAGCGNRRIAAAADATAFGRPDDPDGGRFDSDGGHADGRSRSADSHRRTGSDTGHGRARPDGRAGRRTGAAGERCAAIGSWGRRADGWSSGASCRRGNPNSAATDRRADFRWCRRGRFYRSSSARWRAFDGTASARRRAG